VVEKLCLKVRPAGIIGKGAPRGKIALGNVLGNVV
jgi:hypothetical protein